MKKKKKHREEKMNKNAIAAGQTRPRHLWFVCLLTSVANKHVYEWHYYRLLQAMEIINCFSADIVDTRSTERN
jgi:hypothetical protein